MKTKILAVKILFLFVIEFNMSEEVRIVFLGDISFNDDYNKLYREGVQPFDEIIPILDGADIVAGNLECTARGNEGFNHLKKPYQFTETETLNWLKDLKLDLVGLANNHFYDNLGDGFRKTTDFLDQNKIAWFGSTEDKSRQYEPLLKEIKGIRFGFLNYVSLSTHPTLPQDKEIYTNILENDNVDDRISKLKQECDILILMLHWGGKSDYGAYPHHSQRPIARNLITAGADLIVGCHTHTFQAKEKIKGKEVYYSLGNFCYADIHCEGKISPVRPGGKRGGLLEVRFSKENGLTSHVIPIKNEKLQIKPAPRLNRRFSKHNKLLSVALSFPIRYFYYFWLKRIEPIMFYLNSGEKSFWQKIRSINGRKLSELFKHVFRK